MFTVPKVSYAIVSKLQIEQINIAVYLTFDSSLLPLSHYVLTRETQQNGFIVRIKELNTPDLN